MQRIFVKFDDAGQVRDFVNEINKVEANFRLGSGKRIVNPKAILGVYTLDLTQPQELRCDSDDFRWMERIAPFLYKKKMRRG